MKRPLRIEVLRVLAFLVVWVMSGALVGFLGLLYVHDAPAMMLVAWFIGSAGLLLGAEAANKF